MTSPDQAPAPPAWQDLIEGLTLLARHPSDKTSPLHCEHDVLYVHADDRAFTAEEIDRLHRLGFVRGSDGGFSSFRFGS